MQIENLLILTDEQLVKMAQEGSETAEEILIEKYKPFVKGKSQAYYIIGADSDDVIQEGMIGLFKAIRGFNPDKETGFKTFANTCINNQILTAIKKADRDKHQPLNDSLSLNREIETGDDTTIGDILKASIDQEPENVLLQKEVISELSAGESSLFSDFEWKVLSLKMKEKSYQEIALELGKTPKQIDNCLQRIKKKLIRFLEEG